MRLILILIFISSEFIGFAQTKENKFSITPILGFRIHNDRHESIGAGLHPKVLSTSVFGLEIKHRKYPFSLGYQRDYNQFFRSYNNQATSERWSIREIWEEDQIQLYWHLNYFSLGLGHYWKKRESPFHHFLPDLFVLKRKGIQVSLSYPTHWLDIELRTKLQYDPDFAGLVGLNNYSLLFLYRIGAKRKTVSHLKFLRVNAIVGARAFTHNIELLPGESFNSPIALAPSIGFEFLIHQINLSVNVEKDWWLSFNAGSGRRDVKGLIYHSFIGARYHLQLKNKRHLRFGLGASWIEDNEVKLENITLTPTPEQQKQGNYQVKGLSVTLSYEVLQNTDLEFRTTLPTIGEKIFENPARTSLGLFYRFNPLRKKK